MDSAASSTSMTSSIGVFRPDKKIIPSPLSGTGTQGVISDQSVGSTTAKANTISGSTATSATANTIGVSANSSSALETKELDTTNVSPGSDLSVSPLNAPTAHQAINSYTGSPPVCRNCQTSTTPLWRRDEGGQVLCNACGLFLKLHHVPRPISLKTDVIKSRNRIRSNGTPSKMVSSSTSAANSSGSPVSSPKVLEFEITAPSSRSPGATTTTTTITTTTTSTTASTTPRATNMSPANGGSPASINVGSGSGGGGSSSSSNGPKKSKKSTTYGTSKFRSTISNSNPSSVGTPIPVGATAKDSYAPKRDARTPASTITTAVSIGSSPGMATTTASTSPVLHNHASFNYVWPPYSASNGNGPGPNNANSSDSSMHTNTSGPAFLSPRPPNAASPSTNSIPQRITSPLLLASSSGSSASSVNSRQPGSVVEPSSSALNSNLGLSAFSPTLSKSLNSNSLGSTSSFAAADKPVLSTLPVPVASNGSTNLHGSPFTFGSTYQGNTVLDQLSAAAAASPYLAPQQPESDTRQPPVVTPKLSAQSRNLNEDGVQATSTRTSYDRSSQARKSSDAVKREASVSSMFMQEDSNSEDRSGENSESEGVTTTSAATSTSGGSADPYEETVVKLKTRVSELELVNDLLNSRIKEIEVSEAAARQCEAAFRESESLSRRYVETLEAKVSSLQRQVERLSSKRRSDSKGSVSSSDRDSVSYGSDDSHKKSKVSDSV